MTSYRLGPVSTGELTALAAVRLPARDTPWAGSGDRAAWSGPPTGHGAVPAPRRAPRARSRWAGAIPPQHGAWAFLLVPVLSAFAVSGTSAAGWAFCAAWVCAYPVGYFLGRGLTVRARRGSWTRLAARERGRAGPWALATAALGLPLAWTRPWLLAVAAALAVLWSAGLVVAARRGERSLATDALLVAQAVAAVPLAVAVVAGPAAMVGPLGPATLQCTLAVAMFLAGSVLHVKALLRRAGSGSFRRLAVGWHVGALVVTALSAAGWVVAFGPALVRSVAMRPGLRPASIGAVEAVVSLLVVLAAQLVL